MAVSALAALCYWLAGSSNGGPSITESTIYKPYRIRHGFIKDFNLHKDEILSDLEQAAEQGRKIIFVLEMMLDPTDFPNLTTRLKDPVEREALKNDYINLLDKKQTDLTRILETGEAQNTCKLMFLWRVMYLLMNAKSKGYAVSITIEKAPFHIWEKWALSRREYLSNYRRLFESANLDGYIELLRTYYRENDTFIRLRDREYKRQIDELKKTPGRLVLDIRGAYHDCFVTGQNAKTVKNRIERDKQYYLSTTYGSELIRTRRLFGIKVDPEEENRLFACEYIGATVEQALIKLKVKGLKAARMAKRITENLSLEDVHNIAKELETNLAELPSGPKRNKTTIHTIAQWLVQHGKVPENLLKRLAPKDNS